MSNHPLIRLLVLFVLMGVIFIGVKHSMKNTLICTYKGIEMSCNSVHALEELEMLEKEIKTRAMNGENLDKLQIELNFEIARIKTKYRIK